MSSDEERNFDMVLRSLGVRETTINFFYEQSEKEVLHLLLIEEDDITSWKHDRYLSAIECQILFKLRTHVHMCKSNNDDRLPSDWHIGLTLETLSSPSKPNVATRADSPPPPGCLYQTTRFGKCLELDPLSPVCVITYRDLP